MLLHLFDHKPQILPLLTCTSIYWIRRSVFLYSGATDAFCALLTMLYSVVRQDNCELGIVRDMKQNYCGLIQVHSRKFFGGPCKTKTNLKPDIRRSVRDLNLAPENQLPPSPLHMLCGTKLQSRIFPR